ncbi:CoA pyrophosphatase [Brevundimonas variabilis]|uniref:8-oxo-dGTP pyrophosphatase MutT (NUDIX family) n=1 Tax=Brevundimonas variabilis TaxID=74312 RepID=A0A7W9FEL7_9CAUL|nr:CoA pyrophosphatase [Brevundimonas variabilis]MBB5746457.1 8-oxo-dGTP pyrophosphatase MutT (NUDIX family) [Brevundimonas variabilis]
MSHATLKRRLTERLLPIQAWQPLGRAARSDFDLNPEAPRADRTLREAAVLVPIIAHAEGATVLLTRRADALTSHSGQIAFPGGRLDPGETAAQAALREAMEEVALDPACVEVLGFAEPYETVTGFLVTPVVGWIASAPSLTASPGEVADLFETPWDFLMDVANHRRDSFQPAEGPVRHFWAMPWQDRYIWGATAGIIRGLRARLYDDADLDPAIAEDAA